MSRSPRSSGEGPVARFVIAERATLTVLTRSAKEYEAVARSLSPYTPRADGEEPAHVVVERLERPLRERVAERLGDAGDGLRTAWDGTGVRLDHGGAACRLRDGGDGAARVELEPGFPWWRAWSAVVRPLLSVPIAAGGAAVAHASAVALDDAGIAIAGWSESGKTEVALALRERGARFVSDKWTALASDGTLHAMPVAAGLRAWTVPYLPGLRMQLGVARRGRAAAARLLAGALDLAPVRPRGAAGAAALGALRGATELAGRSALAPAALSDRTPAGAVALHAVVVLRCVDGPPAVRSLDAATARARLLTTTAYERGALERLDARIRYAGGAGIAGAARLRAREEAILEGILRGCLVLELTTPFPADPRPAADALLRALPAT